MKEIATALLKAQKEMSNPKKDATNPFFKSKYADLNAVREAVIPILNNNGITVLQPIIHKEGKNFVSTILLHDSGEMMESFTEIVYSKNNDAQAQGSGITYARRYGLSSFVCVGADDDDGNKASQQPKQNTVVDENRNIERLNACKTVDELEQAFKSIANPSKEIIKLTTELKLKLTA
jgi:hypothetical protein